MKIKGIIYVVLACFAWGTACLFVNYLGGAGYSSIEIAAVRCMVAAVCLFAYMLINHGRIVRINLKQFAVVALEGISFFAMAATYFYAMKSTGTSTASMLVSSAPVIVTLFSVIFFKEKMTVKKVLAIILSLIGAGLVVGIVGGFKFDIFGVFMGVMGAVCYASYSICTKIAMKLKMDADVNITYSFCFSALSALVVSRPVSLVRDIAGSDLKTVVLFVGIGIVTGAFAGLMFTEGMKLLPAGIASPLGVLEPITTTVLSVLFLDEMLDLPKVVGIILVIAAVFMLSTESATEKD